MLSLRLAAVSSLLMCTIGCGADYTSPASPSPSPSPTPDGPTASVTIVAGAETLGNRAFAPDDLNTTVGTTVTWINADSVAHTSTSDVAASGWNSGVIAPGGQVSVAFPTAGTFRYHCSIHPGMIGTVVVR
jgi:plastocyanin